MKHARLAAALVKAAAFATSKQQVPLHSDPHMLALLPERLALNRLGGSRRMSLDNSALDRRRWEAAAAAAAATSAAAANGGASPPEPAAVCSSAPAVWGGNASATLSAGAGELTGQQALRLEAQRRRSIDALGGGGGWQPQLSCIMSDTDSGGDSSQRSSLDLPPSLLAPMGIGPMAPIPEGSAAPADLADAVQHAAMAAMSQVPGAASASPFSTAPAPAPGSSRSSSAEPAEPAEPAAPAALRILVAEDNLINQRVIGKVLQRCVPGAHVTVVGDGAQALAAALASRFDLVLMDLHMPCMDGLEATRRMREELPPAERPVVVALSADTQARVARVGAGGGMGCTPVLIPCTSRCSLRTPPTQATCDPTTHPLIHPPTRPPTRPADAGRPLRRRRLCLLHLQAVPRGGCGGGAGPGAQQQPRLHSRSPTRRCRRRPEPHQRWRRGRGRRHLRGAGPAPRQGPPPNVV